MTTDEYLASIHAALVVSPVVESYAVVRQWLTSQMGHLRVRIILTNGDFLESAELFRLTPKGITVVDYRHQWMDGSRTRLRKRWDSTPHHPELDRFPYHCHNGDERNVIPSDPFSICEILEIIRREIAP